MCRSGRKKVWEMVVKTVSIKCPHCGSEQVSKNGHNKAGKQVYRCNNPECSHRYFVEEYTNRAWDPKVRKQVLKLAIDCTGTRATHSRLSKHGIPMSFLSCDTRFSP